MATTRDTSHFSHFGSIFLTASYRLTFEAVIMMTQMRADAQNRGHAAMR